MRLVISGQTKEMQAAAANTYTLLVNRQNTQNGSSHITPTFIGINVHLLRIILCGLGGLFFFKEGRVIYLKSTTELSYF